MYLQLFYLSIIIGFSYFLSFDFQFAKIRIFSGTAKTISSHTAHNHVLTEVAQCLTVELSHRLLPLKTLTDKKNSSRD